MVGAMHQFLTLMLDVFLGEDSVEVVKQVEMWLYWKKQNLEHIICAEIMKLICTICTFMGASPQWWIKILLERESVAPPLI